MTPAELETIRRLVRDALRTAIGPLQEEIDELKAVAIQGQTNDRRHSIRIAAESRRAESEATRTSEEMVLAATAHVVAEMERMRAETRAELAQQSERLEKIERAVPKAEKAAVSAELSTARIQSDTARLTSFWRHPAFNQTINAIVVAVLSWAAAHGGHC